MQVSQFPSPSNRFANFPSIVQLHSGISVNTSMPEMGSRSNALMWFRKGLRIHDNPALEYAAKNSEHLYPVFVIDPHYMEPDPAAFSPGSSRAGLNRIRFLLESLVDLDASFKKLGSRLIVLKGEPFQVLMHYLKEWDISKLCFEFDTDPYYLALDDKVKSYASTAGIEVFSPVSHTLFNPAEIIQKNGGRPPLTYQSFIKVAGQPSWSSTPLSISLSCLPPIGNPGHDLVAEVASVNDLGYEETEEDERTPFKGGESEALRRLKESMANKEWVANFEKPKGDPSAFLKPATTVLSPYLKVIQLKSLFSFISFMKYSDDLISSLFLDYIGSSVVFHPGISTCVFRKFKEMLKSIHLHQFPFLDRSMRQFHMLFQMTLLLSDTVLNWLVLKLILQLLWREFFYTVAFGTPNFDRMQGNRICKQIPWDNNNDLIASWRDSKTGFPWIDANMVQLRKWGWMHHLARHCVACFLTRGDMFQHWEKGRDVFERLLIDSDWAINNGNWLWLSCSSFFYQYNRIYSPISFGKKYDPNGNYIRHFLPVLKDMPKEYIYEPWTAPPSIQRKAKCIIGVDYPKPVVSHETASKECRRRLGEAYELNKKLNGAVTDEDLKKLRRKLDEEKVQDSKSKRLKQTLLG
ncbi:OLC1v1014654C1 [Oldenlandia corymbosa var. corymbosa]|uniref:(6-4)DNA photolyase n=1 Tax=Oldenlandia corymbosa var. corymbosa TaxID=529605 RepID=A0AAV1E1J5_OLDCO|nr:OLC1v1014654C1 [Oldenlandia corymbosa var. corymbosa]